MGMPNFLIIGAQKAGTTALYSFLKQHPQIYMSPIKEPHFFTYEGEKLDYLKPVVITNIEDYCNLFQEVSKGIVMGEASPSYIYSPRAPERIQHYIPEAKLIAILRHPAERAYSNFIFNIQRGNEPLKDFAQALREEETRISNNSGFRWHYKHKGFYYTQMKRYFDRFDRSQIRVYLYEDLNTNLVSVLQSIFQFLGVDETFMPDVSHKSNVSLVPKNETIHILVTRLNSAKRVLKLYLPERFQAYIKSQIFDKPPPLPPEIRRQLIDVYREDILQLQDLIQQDLSSWLE
ncbi:MAG: sulfotransferase domain-containing protein [Gloeocapsa sp. UFS-A4-WI-NPMV-4B04]|jgi:hypothetical protein|nr:sulfotransferase domain-containing protein [Gloeocapsa sp. UFS-A4-WI-NPMV-4B04]